MKKPVSLRLDETLIEQVRERVGPRGLTELVESLLIQHLSGGGPNREDGRPTASGPPPLRRGITPPDTHEHIWSKHRGTSGVVVFRCACGVVA